MPNSLSIARLALNCVWTLLGVLAAKEREELIRPSLPALARICRAFPPLIEDTVQLLIQVNSPWKNKKTWTWLDQAARMWLSSRSVSGYTAPRLCTTGTLLTSRQVCFLYYSECLSMNSSGCEWGAKRLARGEQLSWRNRCHFWNNPWRDHICQKSVLVTPQH